MLEKMRFLASVLLAFACLFAQSSSPPKKSALEKATLESYIRHLFVWGPQISVQVHDPQPAPMPGFQAVKITGSAGRATQEEVFYVSNDGQKILRGMVFDVTKNPFQNDLQKLKTEFQPSFGAPGAPVVVVMFSDFQCTYCKEEAKMIRSNLQSMYPKQVRVYFKDFPLDPVHPWARAASIAGRCVFRQAPAAFWEYHDWVFEHQDQITVENFRTKIQEWAKGKELDPVPLTRCLEARATEPEVDRNVAEGRALNVNSTPTLFVNGRRLVGNIGWPQLRGVIDYEIEYQKTAKNAGEDCSCEVKLPSPLNQ